MFCGQCGKKIGNDSKFCCYCGAATRIVAKQDAINEKPAVCSSGTENKKKYRIIAAAGAVILLAAGITLAVFWKGEEPAAMMAEKEQELPEEQEEAKETEKTQEDKDADGEPLAGESVKEDVFRLLVCVPAEYMSLRSSPGLGDDVIAQLPAGTYLKWYGESVTDHELDFYKVTVMETGQEGYVSAKYCVNVDFDADEDKLTVVQTDSALYTYDRMREDISVLCQRYPDRLCSRVIGTSVDGRDIYEVVLGNPDAENHIMLQAGIHGREYITSQLIMKMLEYYACYYEEGEYDHVPYKELFQKTAVHAVPMSNPDGITISQLGVDALYNSSFADFLYECYERDKITLVYEEDMNGDMNWCDYYKNPDYDREKEGDTREITFEEYQTIWKANAYGVDLNNNFDAGWEDLDLKQYPAYGSFKGYYAVSEPETQALVSMALERDYKCFLSYHSRGQLIYYDVKGNSAENSMASENFARLLESCIKYEPVNTGKGYNVNLGGFGDWIQLSLNKPSVTIENGKKPCPIGAEEFPAIWCRNRESWAMLARQFYE